jgi:hypothetical protein
MTTAAPRRLLTTSTILSLFGLALVGCGGGTPTTQAPTTQASTTQAPTTAAPVAASPAGATGGDAPRPLVCDNLKTSVSVAYDTPVETMTELGGICTATLRGGDRVELLWNRFASNETSFATTTRGLTRIDVGGTGHAAAGFDDLGARVKALIDGKGTWELSLTPEYTAARAPVQADVNNLARLAEVLIGHGQPS